MIAAPQVPGYKVLSLLGRGGMGQVYLAEDTTLRRKAAIKFLSSPRGLDEEAHARFLREARSMATVEHTNVVRVYGFGETETGAYLAMEYAAGESLGALLKKAGPFDLPRVTSYALQVADALDAAWERRLIHRDIKPSNILLTEKGEVRVADFGLAKPLGIEGADESLTGTGSVLGSPPYVSPEQAQGLNIDFRTDIYSLGIVIFELLAGERPFRGTAFDVVSQHINAPMPSLAARCPGLLPEADELVQWMTRKAMEQRPGSYAEVRASLRNLAELDPQSVAKTTKMKRGARGVLAGLVGTGEALARRLSGEPTGARPDLARPLAPPPMPEPPPAPTPLSLHAPVEEVVEEIETEHLSVTDRTLVAPSLKPVGGPKNQKGFPIRLDGPTSVGRARRNDVVIASDLASAEHCVIEIGAEGLVVRDLGSTNGTFVNEARIKRSLLRNGDRLGVGKVVLVVDLHGEA